MDGPSIVTILHEVNGKMRQDIAARKAAGPSAGQSVAPTPTLAAPSIPPVAKLAGHTTSEQAPKSSSPAAAIALPTVINIPSGDPHHTHVAPQPAEPVASSSTLSTPPQSNDRNTGRPSIPFANLSQPKTPLSHPGVSRPTVLSPQSANPGSLARDILRSLGRPSSVPSLDMLSAPSSSSATSESLAKRKRSTPVEDVVDKRQRTSDAPAPSQPSETPATHISEIQPSGTPATRNNQPQPSETPATQIHEPQPSEIPAMPTGKPQPSHQPEAATARLPKARSFRQPAQSPAQPNGASQLMNAMRSLMTSAPSGSNRSARPGPGPSKLKTAPVVEAEAPAPAPVHDDEDVVVVEEAEEIHTPGVIEMALEEAVAAVMDQRNDAHAQDRSSPMTGVPPAGRSGFSSVASPPPSSRSPSPPTAHTQLAGVPNSDIDMFAHDDVPPLQPSLSTVQHDLIPPIATISDSSPTGPLTPTAGPSKQPLFFVSPGSPEDAMRPSAPLDDQEIPDCLPTGLLDAGLPMPLNKGKHRALDDEDIMEVDAPRPPSRPASTDSDIEIIDPPEPSMPRPWHGAIPQARPFVAVPPPSEAFRDFVETTKNRSYGPKVYRGRIISPDDTSEDGVTGQCGSLILVSCSFLHLASQKASHRPKKACETAVELCCGNWK